MPSCSKEKMMTDVALVTGAEQGLGQSIKNLLEENGLTVYNLPGSVIRAGKTAIDETLRDLPLKGLRYIVNNFGINHLSWIGNTPEEDEAIYRVNVMGPYWVVNYLVSAGHLRVRCLNIASQTYRVAQRTTALYCASKAALVQMTAVMGRELADRDWTVNALAPGKITDTEMSELTDAQVLDLRGWTRDHADDYAKKMIPAGRFTSRAEIARAAWQVLQFPRYVTGTTIDVMGGV